MRENINILDFTNQGEISRGNFDQQYDNPETVGVGKNSFQIYDVKPNYEKTEVPVLFGPGFPPNPKLHRENVFNLSNKGRRVIFPYAPHGVDPDNIITDAEIETIPEVAKAELRKVAAFLRTIDTKGLEKINGIGYSEGGLHLITAALLRPEKFQNIILLDPVGIVGKQSISSLLMGGARDTLKETKLVKTEIEQAEKEGRQPNLNERELPLDLKHMLNFLASRFPAALKELKAISASDVLEMLAALKEKGIGVSIIHGAEDKLFPMEKVQEQVQAKHLDGFYSVKGTHTRFSANPEQYAMLLDTALSDLEKLKTQRKDESADVVAEAA